MGLRSEVFTTKVSTGKRTYFFNVKENRTGDLYMDIVESKKATEADFERHSIVLFKDDMENFLGGFQEAIEFMKAGKK